MVHPPKIVCSLCYIHSAWVVGGAARAEKPRDWDVVVPFSQWFGASLLIPREAKPNTFGGFKFQDEGEEVDVWPGDMGELMTLGDTTHLWHPKTGFRWARV